MAGEQLLSLISLTEVSGPPSISNVSKVAFRQAERRAQLLLEEIYHNINSHWKGVQEFRNQYRMPNLLLATHDYRTAATQKRYADLQKS
jgi:hypothetical protein